MPFYFVRKKDTDVVQPLPPMKFSELQKFLEENPDYEQVITAPAMVKVN